MLKMIAPVFPRDGLLAALPRAGAWNAPHATASATGGSIAHPHLSMLARRLPVGKRPFIPLSDQA